MADIKDIRVRLFEDVLGNTFQDAIYYKDEAEYQSKVADGSHAAEKAKRIANQINAVQNPPKPIPPTKEMLLAESQSIADQKVQLDQRLSDIAIALVDAKPADIGGIAEEIVK